MTSIAYASVSVQTSPRSAPVPPAWFGEAALLIQYLHKHGVFDAISAQVRFARRRFGRFEVIDFVAVLFGYALSGERTLQAFYERLQPWASAFMALFERDGLPSRAALSRWLAALTPEPVEALPPAFSPICSLGSFAMRSRPAACGIALAKHGWSSTWMAPARRPVNALCRKPQTGQRPRDAYVPSALLGIWGASAGKSSARALPCCRRIRTTGSARLATQAMATIARSCAKR